MVKGDGFGHAAMALDKFFNVSSRIIDIDCWVVQVGHAIKVTTMKSPVDLHIADVCAFDI